jgi:hypothetical protein
MRKSLFFFTILLFQTSISFAQNRIVTRGAESGELYLSESWYGIYHEGTPFYDTLRTAFYHITENGKKLTIQYDADYFANPEDIVQPQYIIADATPGVIYNVQHYPKNNYSHTALWVSFDYGKNWTFREEIIGNKSYFSSNETALIFRSGGESSTGEAFKSFNYGVTFNMMETVSIAGEPALIDEEFFFINGSYSYQYNLMHTYNSYLTYTEIPIDGQFVFGSISGIYPDVYRGGKASEVYVSSLFPDPNYYVTYKVSFSTDTGNTFRHVFVSESYANGGAITPLFMSDRESGVFYIIRRYELVDTKPWGWHLKICVEYYRDYGETLVDTYCHDVHKNYKNEVGIEELQITDYELRIYPNPTTGELTIDNGELTIINVEVFDVYSKKLSSHHLTTSSSHHQINISHLSAGIYFVKIITEKGIITRKVVKY